MVSIHVVVQIVLALVVALWVLRVMVRSMIAILGESLRRLTDALGLATHSMLTIHYALLTIH